MKRQVEIRDGCIAMTLQMKLAMPFGGPLEPPVRKVYKSASSAAELYTNYVSAEMWRARELGPTMRTPWHIERQKVFRNRIFKLFKKALKSGQIVVFKNTFH